MDLYVHQDLSLGLKEVCEMEKQPLILCCYDSLSLNVLISVGNEISWC